MWVLVGVMGIGWFASVAFVTGKAEIDILHARNKERGTQIAACDAKIRDFAATVNGAADDELNAGNAAAALVPMLKDRAQLKLRCQTSRYCRKADPNGTADADGGE